jgi:flavin-dependent dehydrogenase
MPSSPSIAPSASRDDVYDVLVIGGGPAGSTMGAFLAMRGRRVLLLEKDRHPRFHIGESLLPMNIPIFERLGVRAEIEAIGQYKSGAEFNAPGRDPVRYYFREAMRDSPPHAWQVRRSEFDNLLLRNSARKGVDVREGVRVRDVRFPDGEPVQVDATDENGNALTFRARFLVDASGRDTFLADKFASKQRNPAHNSAAVFGHFAGVTRREGEDAGIISMYWFEHGWYWMIPLQDGAVSIGAVCWPYYLKSRKKPVDEFLLDTLRLNPLLWERVQNARLLAPAQATGNFSYQSDRMFGERHMIVGDAFAFIDPIFSTGVFLAMNGAERGADLVEEFLRDGRIAATSRRQYERDTHKTLKTFSWFIYRITTPAMRRLFMGPRDFLGLRQGMVSFLAADVHNRTPIRFPLFVFKLIYFFTSAQLWRETLAWRRQYRRAFSSRLEYVWKSGT